MARTLPTELSPQPPRMDFDGMVMVMHLALGAITFAKEKRQCENS